MKNFGMAVRESRKQCGLKVYELAKKVGVDPVYITQIEKHGKLPSPLVMKRIADVLKDEFLFKTYLKMKYPALYEQFVKEDSDLTSETNKIADDIAAKKDKTPEENEEFTKRIRNVIVQTRESINKFKKILVRLETIEDAHLKPKNTPHPKDKTKVNFPT